MDKQRVLKAVMDQLKQELDRQKAANAKAAASATDSESRAETKWDTSGLEASYLARGYAHKYEQTVRQYEQLTSLELIDFSHRAIGISALIECDVDGFVCWYFLLPCCGGLDVDMDGNEITVITPESPAGSELLKKTEGATYVLPNGTRGSILKVV